MATKAAAKQKQETAEQGDGPILDLTDADVKKLLKSAKARGYVTYDELNKVLPSEEVSSEQIEDLMAQLSEMGITVVEHEEEEDDEEGEKPAAAATASSSKALATKEEKKAALSRPTPAPPPTAQMILYGCICVRWAA